MTFRVVVQPRAESDVSQLFDWIARQSRDGAVRWFQEWLQTVESLAVNPLRFGFAPENQWSTAEVRQDIFRTRRGSRYRAIYFLDEQTVHVVHVRGPGQALIPPNELGDRPT